VENGHWEAGWTIARLYATAESLVALQQSLGWSGQRSKNISGRQGIDE